MDKGDKEIFLEALLKGNRKKGSAIAKKYAPSHDDIKSFYEDIVKPSLYKIGEMWEYNIITVAAEHLATAVSESIMNELYEDVISLERTPYKVVLGSIEEEQHQVGIKMIADIFEMHGWDTYFLGSNTPINDFMSFIEETDPDIIGLSLSIYTHIPIFEKMIKKIHEQYPDIPVIVGGQAFVHGGQEIAGKYNNTTLISNIYDTEKFIKKFENEDK